MRRCRRRFWLASKVADAAAAGHAHFSAGGGRVCIADESADEVYVSAASIWEVAIKARLGKIEADPDELAAAIDASGFVEFPIRSVHAAGVARLAMHHNDPFDRLLIAKAIAEPLKLLTADGVLAQYSDVVMLV